MALSRLEKLFLQAKNASQEDVDKLCSSILDIFHTPEKSADCTALLQHLYFVLQASDTQPCLPKQLIVNMIEMCQMKDKGKVKECILCHRIVQELLPLDDSSDWSTESKSQGPTQLQLYLIQGKKFGCLAKHMPDAVGWLSTEALDYESQRKAFSFLVAVSILHREHLNTETLQVTNNKLSGWLMNTGLYQAPNPYLSFNPFRKDEDNIVCELDGTSSTNFFTVLNIGQYYTQDQLLNIYTFSMLYQWLHQSQVAMVTQEGESNEEVVTDNTLSRDTWKKVYESLVGRSVDYCFRVLDQCERKPKVASDADLQNACLLETVTILDLVCKLDSSHIPRVFREIKRLYQRLSQDISNTRIMVHVLQFIMNHCSAVAYDPQEAYNLFFHKLLTKSFSSTSVAFETVMFIQDNLEMLCLDTPVLSTYFPNVLKILAWNPRSYVTEFLDILPALMSENTSLEIFHTLVDLPCMTASLVVIEKVKDTDLSSISISSSDLDPSSSVEAFKNPIYRPMFNFFTRSEGGHGDTINRLGSFHAALSDMIQNPRVLVCCQVVPVLMRMWFSVIIEEGSSDFVSKLIPVFLERTGLLYGIPSYQTDIKRIISENLTMLLKKFPEVVLREKPEILEFLSSARNISGREDFFCLLVWSMGEYSSAVYDRECTADTIGQIYEALEVLSYEVSGVTASHPAELSPFSVKVISTLMSAIAKLASRCQDLIPRAILCLTKVASQHQNDFLEIDTQDILMNRAQELINLLKLPNFASAILNPPQHLETNRVHRDSTSPTAVLRGTQRLLAPDT